MGKYIRWIFAVVILAPILWIACVGLEDKTIVSPDGRHTIMISSSWRGTYVHLFNRYWWPLNRQYYGPAEPDAVPFAFEWFDDAVAYIDNFDLGTSVHTFTLSDGNELEYLSTREQEIREALRWKYSFTDIRELLKEGRDGASRASYRIYTNPPSEGSLADKPVTFSHYQVLFKLEDGAPLNVGGLKKLAQELLSESCDNANMYEAVEAAYKLDRFFSVGLSCNKPRH